MSATSLPGDTALVPPSAPIDPATIARDVQSVEALRAAWAELAPSYVDADLDCFLAFVRCHPDVLRPHVMLLGTPDAPRALVAGRIEQTAFGCRFGYKTVYRPVLRTLRVAHGGIAGADDDVTAAAVVGMLERSLAAGEADVFVVPAVRADSPLDRALSTMPGRFRRERARENTVHRRLVLPETYEQLLASRDRRSRYNLKRQNGIVEKTLGSSLSIDLLRAPEDFDRILRDLERIASTTYQRGLGAGFADTPERREVVRVALEKGWFRAWVLSVDGNPVAFWQGNAVGTTYFSSSTGFDPAYGRLGVGTYLQLRMFADLCADPAVRVVDFGWGDADYKARFGTEAWLERDVVVFAPSLRGLRVNLVRTVILGLDRTSRRVLHRAGLTRRIKRLWRQRLRSDGAVSTPPD